MTKSEGLCVQYSALAEASGSGALTVEEELELAALRQRIEDLSKEAENRLSKTQRAAEPEGNVMGVAKKIQENTGRLCSVWCPECSAVTEKISFNLLREAGSVNVICPRCGGMTTITYNGKTAELTFLSGQTLDILSGIKKGK